MFEEEGGAQAPKAPPPAYATVVATHTQAGSQRFLREQAPV